MNETINRKYKDSLFRDLFGSPEHKERSLELYNALNGTSYDDPDAIEVTTLEDVVYLNVKNDVSFLIGDEMVLWEHQSTPNPNMPTRGLIYFSRLYSAYITRNNLHIYGNRLIMLPAPRYFVFYAGAEERPDREELWLSDAYGGEGDVEVHCTVININPGRNESVASACPTLAGYSYFVGRVREYNARDGVALRDAVELAIDDTIAAGYLVDYLREKRAQVIDMFMTEFDEERIRELDRLEGYEEGRKEGRKEAHDALVASIARMVSSGRLDAAEAASGFGVAEEEIQAAMQSLQQMA